jgi:hypothetical protein
MNRKGTGKTSGAPDSYGTGGEPRADFVNNITVPMANYLVSALGVQEFRNTNILGDGDRWTDGNGIGVVGNTVSLIPTINVGLIGCYSSVHILTLNKKGIIDIVGATPAIIGEANTKRGYLNLWNNVSRETESNGFYVVSVKGTGGENIVGGDDSYPNSIPHVIVYSKKYAGALVPGAAVQVPYHKAFVNASGQVKVVDPDMSGIDDKYKGIGKTQAIPSLDEAEWIAAGIAGLDKPASDLSSTGYAGLPSGYKWTDAADFNSNAVASAAPLDMPIHLAGMRRPLVEAVLPSLLHRRERGV